MAVKRMHGVVVSISPLEIRAQRKSYLAAEPVEGLARGNVVTFVLGETATKVKAAAPKKGPRFVQGRHHGIISCAQGPSGEYLVWTSISSLDPYSREDDDDVYGEPVELGDYVAFDVMADDGLAWNPDFRGRRG